MIYEDLLKRIRNPVAENDATIYVGEFACMAFGKHACLPGLDIAIQCFSILYIMSPVFDPVIFGTQFLVPISTGGTLTSGTSQFALLTNHQYGATDTIAVTLVRHQFKFGADVLYAQWRQQQGVWRAHYSGPTHV